LTAIYPEFRTVIFRASKIFDDMSKRQSPEPLFHNFYISNSMFIKQINKMIIRDNNNNVAVTGGALVFTSQKLSWQFSSHWQCQAWHMYRKDKSKVKATLLVHCMEIKFLSS